MKPQKITQDLTNQHLAPFAKYLNTKVCPKEMRIATRQENVTFLTNGKLFVEDQTHQLIYGKSFCIENFFTTDDLNESGAIYVSAFLCQNEEPEQRIAKNRSKKGDPYNSCNDLNLNEM